MALSAEYRFEPFAGKHFIKDWKVCQLIVYDLFVVSHTYVPGYIRKFVEHIVCKISRCLQATNSINYLR